MLIRKRLTNFFLFIVFLGCLIMMVLMGLQNEVDLGTFDLQTILDKDNETRSNDRPKDTKSKPQKAASVNKQNIKYILKILEKYSRNWTKHEENHQKFRSLLISKCNGFQKAVITQFNTPLDSNVVFDGDGKVLKANKNIFRNLIKENPFATKMLDTCAVVGNGGILSNSMCGEAIDSTQFVIRCNLPPLNATYEKHVGTKTNLVTASPGAITKKYEALNIFRRQFMEDVSVYGESLLYLPAFSYGPKTEICLKALYTLKDFKSPIKTVFMNPIYLKCLDTFWRSQGLDPHNRLSSGLMMVSLALEICNKVDVFGFWPFDRHPFEYEPLTNHYFDNEKPSPHFHAMPKEFSYLMKLHNEGVLKLHLGKCHSQNNSSS